MKTVMVQSIAYWVLRLFVFIPLLTTHYSLLSQVKMTNKGASIYISPNTGVNVKGDMRHDSASIIHNYGTVKTDVTQTYGTIELKGDSSEWRIDSVILLEKGKLLLNENSLIIYNSDTFALQADSGKIVAEDSSLGKVKWFIGESVSKYTIPFINNNENDLAFILQVDTAGIGNASSYFSVSTYPTDFINSPFPPPVNFINNVNAVDRFWEVHIDSFQTNPVTTLKLKYAEDDLILNQLNESNIIGQRWNNIWWDSVGGTIDTAENLLTIGNFRTEHSLLYLLDSVQYRRISGCFGLDYFYDDCADSHLLALFVSDPYAEFPIRIFPVNSTISLGTLYNQNDTVYSPIIGTSMIFESIVYNNPVQLIEICWQKDTIDLSSNKRFEQKINEDDFVNIGSSIEAYDEFGRSVSYIGRIGQRYEAVAIGSPRSDRGAGSDNGSLWITFIDNNTIVRDENEIDNLANMQTCGSGINLMLSCDFFGSAVAGTNDDFPFAMVVGAQGDGSLGNCVPGPLVPTKKGAVYLVKPFPFLSGDARKIYATNLGYDNATNEGLRLGASVAYMGQLIPGGYHTIVAGAPGDDVMGTNTGVVWIIQMDSFGCDIMNTY